MATWNSDNIILTKLGEQVLSKVQSGVGKLTVSRIVSGAGHVSPSQLYNQTQVTDIKQELTIAKCTTTESQSTISANLTNTTLVEAYDLYQIGIYVTHPDFTDEVLYLIAQCGSPDHIPMPEDNPVTLSYDLVMAHFGTKEVIINVSEAGHVDVTTFTEFVEKTNTALNGKANSTDLDEHKNDNTMHVTTEEKEKWNGKAELSDIPTELPANGGNADTVDRLHASDFYQIESGLRTEAVYYDIFSTTLSSSHACWNKWCHVVGNSSDTSTSDYINNAPESGYGALWYEVFTGGDPNRAFQLAIGCFAWQNNTFIRYQQDGNWSGWKNIADGGNADTVDGKHAKEFMSGYTYVVDSDQALLDWANNVGGNDYTHVLVKRGTWTISEQVNGINLTQSGTKTITGEPGNKIVIELTCKYSDSDKSVVGMYYSDLPNDESYFIQGITINVINKSTDSGPTTPAYSSTCFLNIRNIVDCIMIPNTYFGSTGHNYAIGASGCHNIVGSTVIFNPDHCPISSSATAFSSCSNIINCNAKTVGINVGHAIIYSSCSHIYNSSLDIQARISICGFSLCTDVSNCVINITGSSASASCSGMVNSKKVLNSHVSISGSYYASSVKTYSNSFASMTETSNYTCADTPNGGWNSSEIS